MFRQPIYTGPHRDTGSRHVEAASDGNSLWCTMEGAHVRRVHSEIGEVRLLPYEDLGADEAKMIVRTIRSMGVSCVLLDHRAPHSLTFRAQMAFSQQQSARMLALWVAKRPACVAAASHLASMVRPTCEARLFYTREKAAEWLENHCLEKADA